MRRVPIYGLMAEFANPTDLVLAARRAHEAGYRRMDGYSPFPVEELSDAIGFHKDNVSLVVLIGGLVGGSIGYLMQWWISAISYPINVGGKPYHSWPAFIVVTFEMTVLFAGVAAVLGMLALNGLPQPYHPLFNLPRFQLASRDRFFVVIEATDPKFDLEVTRHFLEEMKPLAVMEVPR